MFHKLVAIEPINMDEGGLKKLQGYAREVVLCPDKPADNAAIIKRIGDADCVLVSYTTRIDKEVIDACKGIRYIGMCCSLYNPESANVDILAAEKKGIVVKGVRDYGDAGVAEFAVGELVNYLHGFHGRRWKNAAFASEITGLRVGIIGLGTVGQVIAAALQFFGAEIYYYSRTRKHALEEQNGYTYLPLEALLRKVELLHTCLTRNTIVLREKEFSLFTGDKILFNTSIGPSFEVEALQGWLNDSSNAFFCDTLGALGDESLLALENVSCMRQSSGFTVQAQRILGEKVLANMDAFLQGNGASRPANCT